METDIATYAAGYVLARVAVLCAFGYTVFSVIARSQSAMTGDVRSATRVGGAHSVPEDRC